MLIKQENQAITSSLQQDLQDAATYAQAAYADATKLAYNADLRMFTAWLAEKRDTDEEDAWKQGVTSDDVAAYLAHRAKQGAKVATLKRFLVALSQYHKVQNKETPTQSESVRKVLQGIQRTHGVAQKKKAPLLAKDVKAIFAQWSSSHPDGLPTQLIRDRALLAVGFAGGFRRSEIAALTVDDIEWTEHGMVVHLRRSKTDQKGEGRKVPIPTGAPATCPVRALKTWLEHARIASGAVFRRLSAHGTALTDGLGEKSVCLIVKNAVQCIGFDPARYAGHSLRAGFVTSAARAGVGVFTIQKTTGHRSMQILSGYVRDTELFDGVTSLL